MAAQGIDSGDLALDLILHDIAEHALRVTGATGAAIAIEWEGALVCRAATGATAPDLGVKVNAQSGLSGTCVRERKMQWCSDTECDGRVDAEASRSLGVRSIIVMPLFVADRMVGVFEIFSPKADAFRDRDVKAMQDVARWVTAAVRAERPTTKASAPVKTAARPSVRAIEPASGEIAGVQHFAQLEAIREQRTRIYRRIAAGLAAVLCLSLWFRGGRRTTQATNPRPTPAVVPSSPQLNARETMTSTAAPDLDSAKQQTRSFASGARKEPANNAALVAYDNTDSILSQVPVADQVGSEARSSPAYAGPSPTNSQLQGASENVAGVPELAEVGTGPSLTVPPALATALSSPAISFPEPIVSTGVVKGRLIYSVQPNYPVDAVQMRIEGPVVVHAVIGKDGSLHELKPVRGDNPMLVKAALKAVQQWRYEPSRLNGAPVEMPIDITIKFNLPK
jgi:TonB family protein